jgi:hypothetical protein
MSLFKKSFQELFKKFVKSKGRFPTPAERDKLRDMALKMKPPGEGQISVTIDGETKNMSAEGIMNFLMKRSKPPRKQVDVKLPKNAKEDILKSYDNLFLRGEDTKYDADVLATDLAERRGFIEEGQDSTDMDQKEYSKLYDEAYSFLTELRFLNRPPKKEGKKTVDLAKELERLTNENLKKRGLGEIKLGDDLPPPKNKKPDVDPELQKSEDRKKMFKDLEQRIETESEMLERMKRQNKESVERLKKKKIEDFKKRNDMEERSIEDFVDEAGGVDPDDPRGIDDFIKGPEPDDFDAAEGGIARVGMNKGGKLLKFLSENNPFQAYRKYLQSVKRRAQTEPKKLFPELAALTSGGILVNRKMKSILEDMKEQDNERFLKEFKADLDKDPFYKDRPELKDELIANYTESLFGEKKATGGRIGFDNGGMTRRTFLKLMGGLASIPVLGKLFKPAAKASKAVEVASKSSGVPAYFPKLVEKIQLLGDDITKTAATKERQVVKKYKNYELTEDLSTGELSIKRDNYVSEEYLQFEPGGSYYDETRKKVIKYPEQYEEVTVKPDYEGKMKDVDSGLDSYDEILKEVGESKIKKSSGGLAYMMGE